MNNPLSAEETILLKNVQGSIIFADGASIQADEFIARMIAVSEINDTHTATQNARIVALECEVERLRGFVSAGIAVVEDYDQGEIGKDRLVSRIGAWRDTVRIQALTQTPDPLPVMNVLRAAEKVNKSATWVEYSDHYALEWTCPDAMRELESAVEALPDYLIGGK